MKTPKKILNEPRQATAEMMEGLILANDGRVGIVSKAVTFTFSMFWVVILVCQLANHVFYCGNLVVQGRAVAEKGNFILSC